MTSSNAHSKAPSLLADTQDNNTPDIRPVNNAAQPSISSRKTLYTWLSIVALTLVTSMAWVFDSSPQEVSEAPAEAHTASNAMSEQTPPPMIGESAQIFNEPRTEQHANLISASVHPTPSKTPVIQAIKPYPPAPTARSAHSASSPSRSSDVDVLIALMRYIESPDNDLPPPARKALQDRVKACPAANTEAGIDCRQRICADLPGSMSLCPLP